MGGANAEVDIFLKKEEMSLKQLFSLLEKEGLAVSIKEILIFDDWQFTNQIGIDPKSFDLNDRTLFLKKFTIIRFVVNSTWRCVLVTSFGDSHLNLSFGLNIDDLSLEGEADYDAQVASLYAQVIDRINDAIGEKPWQDLFLAASMGVEYGVQFNKDIMVMLNDDNGAVRWIVPKQSGEPLSTPKRFFRKEKSNTIVFYEA